MFKHTILLAAVVGLVFALAPSAQAGLTGPNGIICPTGEHPTLARDWDVGDTYRLVFVTSTTTTGTSDDIEFYNTFVRTAAASSTQTGVSGLEWNAIGSTTAVSAKVNTSTGDTGFPIYLLDGTTKVADDYGDLWDGGIDSPIIKDEYLVTINNKSNIFTGTGIGGIGIGFELGAGDGVTGEVTIGRPKPSSDWVSFGTQSETNSYRMYAMSPELVIVPEPCTLALLGLGGLGLLFGRKRK